MDCESRQEQVGSLIDGELGEHDQVALFRHLEECLDCRSFLHSMIRVRNAVRLDREEILATANEVLPASIRLDAGERTPVGHGWREVLTGWWRLPAPVAVGLGVALLLCGALLGARVATTMGPGQNGHAGGTTRPTVIVVCSLPEVEVVGPGPGR